MARVGKVAPVLRTIWTVFLGSLALAGCRSTTMPKACSALPDGRARPVLVAPYRSGIVLDGDLGDWRGIAFTTVTPATGTFDQQPARTDSAADLSFRFATCHDDEALYVAVEVTDDSIRADSCPAGSISCPAWDDDAVEVFVDGNHDHAPDSRLKDGSELAFGGEFALVVNGAASSDYSGYPRTFGRPGGWQGATNWQAILQGQKTARYEFRIAWTVMGGRVKTGDTIGFNLSVQDDDDGNGREHALYFRGSPLRPFSDERYFADLHLETR